MDTTAELFSHKSKQELQKLKTDSDAVNQCLEKLDSYRNAALYTLQSKADEFIKADSRCQLEHIWKLRLAGTESKDVQSNWIPVAPCESIG